MQGLKHTCQLYRKLSLQKQRGLQDGLALAAMQCDFQEHQRTLDTPAPPQMELGQL